MKYWIYIPIILVIIYLGFVVRSLMVGHFTLFPFYTVFSYSSKTFDGPTMTCYGYNGKPKCVEPTPFPSTGIHFYGNDCSEVCIGIPTYGSGFPSMN